MDYYRPRDKWKSFLCQGDVLRDVTIVRAEPIFLLGLPEGSEAVEVQDGLTVSIRDVATTEGAFEDGIEWAAVTVTRTHAMILSQTCDIEHREFVLVAPVLPLSDVERESSSTARLIRDFKVFYRFYLPAIPSDEETATQGLPESFVDLTSVRSVSHDSLQMQQRIASLTSGGYRLLTGALNCFLTRPGRPDEY